MTAHTVNAFIHLRVSAEEATFQLRAAVETLGATTLRWLKAEYEDAGAPYGLDMVGFKEWLIEQGHGAIVQTWESP